MRAKSEQLGYVQQRVAQGDYRVNSNRVAAAMLQRIGAIVLDREISGEVDRGLQQVASARQGA